MSKHLTLEDRYYIRVRYKIDTLTDIANKLKRSVSTISREIKRNWSSIGYDEDRAQMKAMRRIKYKNKKKKIGSPEILFIGNCIKLDWSPEQICGWLKSNFNLKLHHETIYRYLLKDKERGGELYKHLRHCNKKYRKRFSTSNSAGSIPDRVDIDLRPDIANDRSRIGDWEADTIIGKNHKGCIVTVDERVSKLRLALPLNHRHSNKVSDSIIALLYRFQDVVHTITFDNGKEFAGHKKISSHLQCDTYFAKPYHSWERGQNENANGLLRQYFPKKMELLDVTVKNVMIAIDKLNSRPKKCLGYRTPYEEFFRLTGINAREFVVLHL